MYKYSVLIPAYNAENNISRTLDSVIQQNNNLLEIIVLDDGSTDNTAIILDDYAKKYDFIKVIHQENIYNLLKVRSTLIDNAQGEYILFLDSDDDWTKNLIETIDKKIVETDPDILLFNNFVIRDGEAKEVISDFDVDLNVKETRKQSLIYQIVKSNQYNALWKKCFKRCLFDTSKLENLNASIGEDTALNLNALLKANKIEYINDCLYNYYISSGSITATHKISYFRDFKDVCFVMKNTLVELGLYELYEPEYAKRALGMLVAPFGRVELKTKEEKDIYKQAFIDRNNNLEFVTLYKKYKNELSFIFKVMCHAVVNNNFTLMLFINKLMNCKLAKLYLKKRR